MLLWENKKQKLLKILKIGINPFKKFVSTGEIKENLGLVSSRTDFLNDLEDIINKNENFILPIIGEIGVGKTHLFWALKDQLKDNYNTIYLSLENIYKRFYYNLYSEFIESIGVENLRIITNNLCFKWNGIDKKYGFFPISNLQKARNNGIERYGPSIDDKRALNDVINVITSHRLDPYNRIEAENYLLGELLNVRELSALNVEKDLRDKNNAFVLLKILIENSKSGTLIFIDNFEKIISLLKPNDETEVVFDSSWLYGSTENPDSRTAKKILKKILKLQKINSLRIIITLNSLNSLEEIKKLVSNIDHNLLLTFKDPVFLSKFQEGDIYSFYKDNMKEFLQHINYQDLTDEFANSYHPLTKEALKYIYQKADGNPREVIKLLIRIFNELIYHDATANDIDCRYKELC
ncbi:MAG: hypothetical protein GF317_17280 [Candidatus Lokiarchaeota archaeon]|nr:hypothetical protein [Candidatus Lokiarchaeota archaeon]MBD3201272.1 hypothetical protein [Candidatus Lokiarchaeota archaeon]